MEGESLANIDILMLSFLVRLGYACVRNFPFIHFNSSSHLHSLAIVGQQLTPLPLEHVPGWLPFTMALLHSTKALAT